jgi:hypothetical protein
VEVVPGNRVHLVQHIVTEFRVGEFIFGGFRCIEYIKKNCPYFMPKMPNFEFFLDNT